LKLEVGEQMALIPIESRLSAISFSSWIFVGSSEEAFDGLESFHSRVGPIRADTGGGRQEHELAMSLLAHAYLCRFTPVFQSKGTCNGNDEAPFCGKLRIVAEI